MQLEVMNVLLNYIHLCKFPVPIEFFCGNIVTLTNGISFAMWLNPFSIEQLAVISVTMSSATRGERLSWHAREWTLVQSVKRPALKKDQDNWLTTGSKDDELPDCKLWFLTCVHVKLAEQAFSLIEMTLSTSIQFRPASVTFYFSPTHLIICWWQMRNFSKVIKNEVSCLKDTLLVVIERWQEAFIINFTPWPYIVSSRHSGCCVYI